MWGRTIKNHDSDFSNHPALHRSATPSDSIKIDLETAESTGIAEAKGRRSLLKTLLSDLRALCVSILPDFRIQELAERCGAER